MKRLKEYLPIVVVGACLVKVLMSEPSLPGSLMLLVALAAFGLNTYLESKADAQFDLLKSELLELELKLEDSSNILESRIANIHNELEAFKPIQAQVAKSAEDIKKVISTTSLGQSLYQRVRKREQTN